MAMIPSTPTTAATTATKRLQASIIGVVVAAALVAALIIAGIEAAEVDHEVEDWLKLVPPLAWLVLPRMRWGRGMRGRGMIVSDRDRVRSWQSILYTQAGDTNNKSRTRRPLL
jgi:hypothetical protein